MAITVTKRLQEIVDLLDQKGYVKAKELSQKAKRMQEACEHGKKELLKKNMVEQHLQR